jgi:hypothetical protein
MGNSPGLDSSQQEAAKEPGQEDYENAIRQLNVGNGEAAVRLLKKAIDETDYQKARIQLGLMYRDGRVVEQNSKEAIALFSGAKDDGVGDTHIGLMYLKGLGVDKNPSKAITLFETAVDNDNKEAQCHLGFCKVRGYGTDKDEEAGLQLIKDALNRTPEADAYFGLMYLEGLGVETNYALALEHLQKAVQAGHSDAHIFLAEIHLSGKGVPKDPWLAAKLLLRAAEKGNARAQCFVGLMYRDGNGLAQEPKLARRWLHASALQGDTLGMYSWGKYLLDSGKEWDWAQVVDWLTKAASKGNTDGDVYDSLYIDGLARIFKIDENK